MRKKNDIVVLYAPPFDQAAQLSKHHFARLWAKDRRVLYVEAPINPVSFLTRKLGAKVLWERFKNGPINFGDNLWVTTYFYLLPFRGSRFLFGGRWVNRFNQYFIKNKLKAQIKTLNLYNPILFIGGAHAYPLLKNFKRLIKIYHCSDDYTLVPSFPDSFEKLEISLIKDCDLIVTTADKLKESKKVYNSNTVSIPNGADINHFLKTQDQNTIIPMEMKKINKPVVGYIGSVFRWLDLEWIDFASETYPDYHFIFIGPVSIDISKLKDRNNIQFFGSRPYETLPGYLRKFDVAVIPFVIDGVTLKASPIKFYEYLASGVPIVSTELPDLLPLKKYASLVKDKYGFSEKIRDAIENDNDKMKHDRMNIAKEYSWEARFNSLNNYIKDL